ncbi:hypothetical protein MCHI_003086 [Candidatus Magnetoovum chiemensis]|nr:hypothetical protein MCHI_003086 [Candidatus Magnetoovum chiemensis]
MGKLNEKLDSIFASVTFAEAGEFETAREFLKSKKKVLLALKDGQADVKTLNYAVNTCKRLNTALDVLYAGTESERASISTEFIEEVRRHGIECKLIKCSGDIKEEIVKYTNANSDILYVIVESSPDIEASLESKEVSKTFKMLKCPLVVVKEGVVQT